MGEVLAVVTSVLVVAGFIVLAVGDARTSTVVVRHAQWLTVLAVGGLGLSGLIASNWSGLAGAAAAAAVITTIQFFPYRLQTRRGVEWIGKADVRLSIPFGWTLGYHGVGFAFIGFGVALVAGLVVAILTRQPGVPFVPFLALGLVVGLGWALLAAAG